MTPGAFAQAPLTVRNSGNVAMKYRLQNAIQSNPAVPLTLTVSTVPNEAACPATGNPTGATQLYSGPMVGAQMPQLRILAGRIRGAVHAGHPGLVGDSEHQHHIDIHLRC
ncbi:hypothetical protein P9209_27500 [Prescottella defluvii]|nr:hypothetical protein P9209_27500 [Prescottella defluvii]